MIGRGQESKERKEETEPTAKTANRPPLYPYKGGKKRKKGQYRKAPVNTGNYMTITLASSANVGRT